MNAPPRAKSPGPPPSAGRAFLRLLWRSPLLALPFGLFFGVLMGHRFSDYVLIYKLAPALTSRWLMALTAAMIVLGVLYATTA